MGFGFQFRVCIVEDAIWRIAEELRIQNGEVRIRVKGESNAHLYASASSVVGAIVEERRAAEDCSSFESGVILFSVVEVW